MKLYTWSYSTGESDTKEYMEFSKKYCIGYMPDYTYFDYLLFR